MEIDIDSIPVSNSPFLVMPDGSPNIVWSTDEVTFTVTGTLGNTAAHTLRFTSLQFSNEPSGGPTIDDIRLYVVQ